MDSIEQEIQAKGLTAPRITPADIEAAIAAEFTYCVGHALNEAGTYFGVYEVKDGTGNANEHARRHLGLLTICVLVMRNGFTVVGKSACASPENFDAELGRKIARQDAINQCWPLLGYELRSKLAAAPAMEAACDFLKQHAEWCNTQLEKPQPDDKAEALREVGESCRKAIKNLEV